MGNELKLSLENFQSISHGELVFHAGTNVIVGQSNSGKTATFRALKACLSNPAGSQRFIKKGTKASSVILEYNGNQIVWKRTPSESSYIINGEEFLKTGKSSAFKLVDDTGFVLDSDMIMNIEEELQLPFPFGFPKSELFKLYENVFCVSDSAVILKAAKVKEDETKNTIVTLENELLKNKNKLTEITDFKKSADIKFLEEKKDYYKGKLGRINFLNDGLVIIHRAAQIGEFEVPEISFNNKLPDYKILISLRKDLIQLKKLHFLGKELKEIEEPRRADIVLYNNLKKFKKDCEVLQKLKDIKIKETTFADKIKNYNTLKNYSLSLKTLKKQIENKTESLKSIEKIVKEKEGKLKEFKVCPLCHKPL